jgi:hypothetical protein
MLSFGLLLLGRVTHGGCGIGYSNSANTDSTSGTGTGSGSSSGSSSRVSLWDTQRCNPAPQGLPTDQLLAMFLWPVGYHLVLRGALSVRAIITMWGVLVGCVIAAAVRASDLMWVDYWAILLLPFVICTMVQVERLHRMVYLQQRMIADHEVWKVGILQAEKERGNVLELTRKELTAFASSNDEEKRLLTEQRLQFSGQWVGSISSTFLFHSLLPAQPLTSLVLKPFLVILLSSLSLDHHPSSPIITHHHPSSPIITHRHHHPSPPITIPQPSPIIKHHHSPSPSVTHPLRAGRQRRPRPQSPRAVHQTQPIRPAPHLQSDGQASRHLPP